MRFAQCSAGSRMAGLSVALLVPVFSSCRRGKVTLFLLEAAEVEGADGSVLHRTAAAGDENAAVTPAIAAQVLAIAIASLFVCSVLLCSLLCSCCKTL